MKKIKYLICSLLMLIGFLFNGELFILYLDTFQDSYYRASFSFAHLPESITDQKVVEDFISAGEMHDVDFFMLSSVIKSGVKKEITIYGTEGALSHLKKQGIREKEYGSLFLGTTDLRYEVFESIKDVSNYEYCYILGDQDTLDNMHAFKAELINQYGGGFPKLYGSDKETILNLMSVWIIIFSLGLIATMYEILYQKKEVIVRILSGENLKMIFLKSILLDTAVFLFMFSMMALLLKNQSNVLFKLPYVALFFTLFVFVNILISVLILLVNFKKDISGSKNGEALLTANYILKVITTALTIIIFAGNFAVFSKGFDYYQQRDFFEQYSGYNYYRLNYKVDNILGKTDEDDMIMNGSFYKRFQEQSLQYIDLTGNLNMKSPIILVNRPTMADIQKKYPDFYAMAQKMSDEKIYIILPANISSASKECNLAKEICGNYFAMNEEIQVETYQDRIRLVGIYNMQYFESRTMKNPIILFNNTSAQFDDTYLMGLMGYAYTTMYEISEKEFQHFIAEFQLADQIAVESNVLDIYEYNWALISRNMKIILTLSAFLLLLEMMMIVFIIRLEYRLHSVEMALKKIYGYTLLKRNQKIINITVLCFVFSMLGAVICSAVLGFQQGWNFIAGGLLLLILEIGYIFKKSKSIEKKKIPLILKGERV